MTDTLCTSFETAGVIGRYVAGRSPDAEAEDFERHLIACARCQEAVKLGVAIRAELGGSPRVAARMSRTILVAAVALAAGIVAIVSTRAVGGRDLRALGAIGVLPEYGGVEVRSARVNADSLFAAAMERYRAGDIAAARAQLVSARAAGADSVPTSFFLGAIALRDGDARVALREFDVVLRRGETPYFGEACFYAAKAWLLRGNADRALAQLALVPPSHPMIASAARALAGSIAEARR